MMEFKTILNDEMAEAVLFNDWVYGTENKALSEDKLNVGIFNLEGIEALRQNPNHNIFAVYLDVEDSVRLIRYLNRENMTKEKINEMFRRYKADEIDFADVDDLVDYKLTIEDNENKMVVADRVLRMAFENFEIL